MLVYVVPLILNLVFLVTANDPTTHPNWPPTDAICGISYSDRIVGGMKASLGQYPWMARIGYNSMSCFFPSIERLRKIVNLKINSF